ncbi:EamA family transporter [Lysobacter sp. TY2-98]|uniref:EamA family transporter n=1 Tax=Lysobacter sp. TY2-98 TaxID=2290922 RepID=UPI000E1FFB4E|nr:EamA family transporter [Lysobacter sp. TY2-98]AXK71236.1 EamA family transporter [Lysobacter sp. TY2-98]AXK71243.1 EamA family transporter [Lysobacter sp. TY2-98]
MDKWVTYAVISMIFAGFTSVIAKMGLAGISGELGLAVRTMFVAVFVIGFAALFVAPAELKSLAPHNLFWLGVSGVTTSLSWIFYYKALKQGEVSTIALIDKASFIVAVLLAWLILKEQITPRVILGCVLVGSGLLVVAYRPAT